MNKYKVYLEAVPYLIIEGTNTNISENGYLLIFNKSEVVASFNKDKWIFCVMQSETDTTKAITNSIQSAISAAGISR